MLGKLIGCMFTDPINSMFRIRAPEIPVGLYAYVVGDVHGRADCLENIFNRIDDDSKNIVESSKYEIYLGDYVDRGQDSKKVLDLLVQRQQQRQTIMLRGNHEYMFCEAFENPDNLADWACMGGIETIASYGVDIQWPLAKDQNLYIHREWVKKVPVSHRVFLKNLRNSFELGSYFFCHAGVRDGIKLRNQSVDDLLWIREEFLSSNVWHGKLVVHGHTPVEQPEFKTNRINIDTGAYITNNLTCIKLYGHEKEIL